MRNIHTRRSCAAALLCFLSVFSANAFAQSLPSHFAAMSGALLPQLRETMKKAGAASPHGALLQKTDDILRQSRLTSAGDTGFTIDLAPYRDALGKALALGDISLPDATAFYQTASQQDMKTALADYFKKQGKPLPEGEDYKKLFDAAKKVQSMPWQGMARDFGIKVSEQQKIDFNWQPEDSLVSVTVSDKGTGKGDAFETRLEGEMDITPDPVTGKVKATAKPLPDPIRPLDSGEMASRDALLERNMAGKWIGETGEVWEFKSDAPAASGGFFGGDKKEMSDEDKRAAEREDAQSRLSELKAKKVYIWKERDDGDEVTQDTFKRLDEKYEYVGEGYPEKAKEEIAKLESQLAAMPAAAKPLPVTQHDPAGMKDMAGGGAVTVTVTEAGGRSYTYDNAIQKGSVITASRTLHDKADISDLPATVVDQLISSWNTPEWIKAEVKEDVRTGDLTLSLEVWRLEVTYSGMDYSVKSIQDPWARKYHLKKDGAQPMSIRYIDDSGDAITGELPYGAPIQVEVEFDKKPEEDTRQVRLSWDGNDLGMTWITVKRSWSNGTTFRSEPFTLTQPACSVAATPAVAAAEKQSCDGGPDVFTF